MSKVQFYSYIWWSFTSMGYCSPSMVCSEPGAPSLPQCRCNCTALYVDDRSPPEMVLVIGILTWTGIDTVSAQTPSKLSKVTWCCAHPSGRCWSWQIWRCAGSFWTETGSDAHFSLSFWWRYWRVTGIFLHSPGCHWPTSLVLKHEEDQWWLIAVEMFEETTINFQSAFVPGPSD